MDHLQQKGSARESLAAGFNILAQDEGPRGTGGNTLGIREDNQTPDTGGRARYLKREGS